MNDAKFLGLCILLASVIVSGSIIWSGKVNEASTEHLQPGSAVTASESPSTNVATVTIQGPVTLSPSSPIPVTITNSDDNPIIIKNVSDKNGPARPVTAG